MQTELTEHAGELISFDIRSVQITEGILFRNIKQFAGHEFSFRIIRQFKIIENTL